MGGLALVTGGCRRLGAFIAARLAEEGYRIALHAGHSTEPEAWLAERLGSESAPVFVADLADAAQVEALPEQVADLFGEPVTLLVNSASRFVATDGDAPGYAAAMAHFGVNVAAPVALAGKVAALAGSRGAAIVNILDQRIVNPPRDQVAYTVSKQALAEATRTLAIALAPHARVNGVAPGLVLPTPDYAVGQMERLGESMPLARLAQPEDVADAVAWLAQARAVTGQVIFVDGGAHLRSWDRDFVHLER